jgi:Thioredoxin
MTNTIQQQGLMRSDFKRYLEKGIGYDAYKQNMAADLALNADLKIREYINLNQRRMHRVEKTYIPSDGIITQVKNLRHKTYWLILTEHWCGDASQTLPVFNAIAGMSEGKIEIKLVYRDQNDKLMNAYLTNETRSIPKLIQLDEHFNVTGIWGPRPTIAQKLVKELKSDSATAATYANELHLWYAKDKQQNLEKEVAQLLFRAGLFCPDCLS